MMTKFMNKQRGLLAAIMALVMVFAGAAFVAAEVDAYSTGVSPQSGVITVTTEADLREALADVNVTNIILGGNIENVASAIDINRTVTIDGSSNKYTIKAADSFDPVWASGQQGQSYLLNIAVSSGTVSLNNLVVDSNSKASGINASGAFTLSVTNVSSINYAKAGFVVGGGITVSMESVQATTTVSDAWGGVNFDKGSSVTIDTLDGVKKAYTENSSGSTNTINITDKSDMWYIEGYSVDGEKIENLYMADVDGDDLTSAFEATKIFIGSDATLKVNIAYDGTDGFTAISSDSLIIKGEGKLDLDVTAKNVEGNKKEQGMDLSVLGIYSNGSITITADVDVDVDSKHTAGEKGDYSAAIVSKGVMDIGTIDGKDTVIVNAHGGNRGIYVSGSVNTLTIYSDAEVNAAGYEKGVRTDGELIVSGTLNAEVCNVNKGTNNAGDDDRNGIKSSGSVTITGEISTESIYALDGIAISGTGILDIEYDADAGRPADAEEEIEAIPLGLNVIGDVSISESAKLIVCGSNFINATVKNTETNTAQFTNVEATSDITITVGSINIDGNYTTDSDGTITITGNAVVSGVVDVPINVTNGTITVPAAGLVLNKDLTFESGQMKVVGDVSGEGTIAGASSITRTSTAIISVNTGSIEISTDKVPAEPIVNKIITTQDEANALKSKMEAATDITIETLTIKDGVTLEIPANITVTLTETIQVGTDNDTTAGGAELIIYGKIVAGGENAKSVKITVEDGSNLYLDGADVRVIIDAEENAYISVDNAKEMTVKGNSTADLGVGYGNTLILSDFEVDAGMSINVYGTIIIEGTVTVEKGAQFNVYASGNAQIDGALVIEGIANIDGAADVNGSVKVYNANGNAAFNVAAGADVDVAGTMDVLVGKNKAQNTLAIKTAESDKMNFVVTGTLNITGTLDGAVYDMGTVAFNGTAAGTNAKIFIFDGMTITIASVAGTLTVQDEIDETDFIKDKEKASISNSVFLKNVKNVTVSTEVTETVKENASKQKIRYYTLNMTVSGAVTSIDDKVFDASEACITISNEGVSAGWADAKVDDRSITIGDITAGKEVGVNIATVEATVAGTITIAAEGSNIVNSSTVAVDVDGAIIIVDKEGIYNQCDVEPINAAAYVVEDKTGSAPFSTYYYTTLDAALAASAEDVDKTIDLFGTMKIESELEVPAGITVDLATGAAMTIDVDGKLTVAATALLDASAGSVKVDGMLVIMDKDTGLNGESKLTYQVLNETETTATYSGLVLALQNAVAGDVITLKQNADITKSVTIPEGVTLVVPKNVTLTVGDDKDDVTLTVAGTLKVEGTVDEETTTKEIAVEVPGVIIKTGTLGVMPEDYVEFTMKIDGRLTTVYSNLAYAAANAVDGDVKVYGDISGGDITFTVADKKTLTITVTTDATLSVGTLTLVGAGASITTADAVAASGSTPAKEAGAITGTIAAAAGSVDLNKVSGIKIEVNVEETVDAKTDIMIVDDTTDGLSGSFTVASGTVTAATGFAMNASKDNKMSVASGATLLVDAVFTATGIVSGDDNYDVIIDGTISVIKNGKATIEYTTVNGTIDVASEGTLTIEGAIVNGTISVAEKTDDAAAGVANVNGALVLGTAPALGANGAFVGPVDIKNDADAFIIAYAGADVSAALIDVENGESTAKSTEIVINGVPYMTVYVDANSSLKLSALQKYFEVEGFETTVDWKDSIDGNTELASVNKIEGTLTAAKTKLTVSAGVGLKVYIDGLAIENFKGLYDVDKTDSDTTGKDGYWIQFGTHTVSFAVESGYDGANATITVNGVAVSNNGTFTVDVDDKDVVIIASGAVPAQSGSTVVVDDADDGMALTDILLIVLVVLIVIMAIIVALRMMRS